MKNLGCKAGHQGENKKVNYITSVFEFIINGLGMERRMGKGI